MRDREPGSDTLPACDRRAGVAFLVGEFVARSAIRVRAARAEDLTALLRLAEELRDASNLRHHVRLPASPDEAMRTRFAALLADPDKQVLVAVDAPGEEGGEDILGMVVVAPDAVSELLDNRAAYLSHLLVAARHRRRGAGRALLLAAVGYADERGLDQVVVGVSPHGREANRFFARLGFVPMVTQRLASVAVLRRSLGLPEAVADVRRGPAAVRRVVAGGLRRPRALARPRERRDLV